MTDEETKWRLQEQKRIAERQHPKIQPDELDCEDCLGSNLQGKYERANKPKGM